MSLKKSFSMRVGNVFVEEQANTADDILVEQIASQTSKEKLEEILGLPKKLLFEMRGFIRRNSLAVIGYSIKNKKPIHYCCPSCLNAHLIKKARDFGFEKDIEESLKKIFDCEIGHRGYYLDRNKLIKLKIG